MLFDYSLFLSRSYFHLSSVVGFMADLPCCSNDLIGWNSFLAYRPSRDQTAFRDNDHYSDRDCSSQIEINRFI